MLAFRRAQVSREPPPPLPGGFVVGEQVYYTGPGQIFGHGDRLESGYRLEHGKQGEVVGPTACESHTGNGLVVQFAGHPCNCYLSQVRCRAHPHLY